MSTVTGLRISTRRMVAAALCILAVACTAAGIPVYVRPQIDPLRPADAIVVLGGGAWQSRYPYGIELGMRGWAHTVALSNPYGTDNDWLTEVCETPPDGIDLVCFRPEPPTTRGEAMELQRIAGERGWRHIIVVTAVPHLSRARYILERCLDTELTMVSGPHTIHTVRWTFEYLYQTAGYFKAVLQPGC